MNQKLINDFRNNVLSSSKKDAIESYSNMKVTGYDFNQGVDFDQLINCFKTTGFQATNLGFAIDLINEMVKLFLILILIFFVHFSFFSLIQIKSRNDAFQDDSLETDPFICRRSGCTIFLGYTSNIVSSGIHDIIRFLVEHKMVEDKLLIKF